MVWGKLRKEGPVSYISANTGVVSLPILKSDQHKKMLHHQLLGSGGGSNTRLLNLVVVREAIL